MYNTATCDQVPNSEMSSSSVQWKVERRNEGDYQECISEGGFALSSKRHECSGGGGDAGTRADKALEN